MLRMHAEALTEQSMVGRAKPEEAPTAPAERSSGAAKRDEDKAAQRASKTDSEAPASVKPEFPKMQMAKTW